MGSTLAEFAFNDKRDAFTYNRGNLLLLTRLVIRGLLERCMQSKCRLINTSDHPQLQDFFVMVEKVFKHGFRGSRMLLKSPDQELWQMLERAGKQSKALEEAVSCIQQLPNVSGGICRLRAWLRLALMQKKLSDYFQILIDSKEILKEHYEEWALLRHENSAVVFVGSLVGLRVLDCNLYLKAEELNKQCSEVDLNSYIKIATLPTEESAPAADRNYDSIADLKSLLDQKNYLEERNKHLLTTIENLRSHSSKNGVVSTQQLEVIKAPDSDSAEVTFEVDDTMVVVNPRGLERVEELETAMAHLEKDIHEKQDTVISLRQQLEDIKKINIDLYQKVRVLEDSGKQREKTIQRQENELESTKTELKKQTDALNSTMKDNEIRTRNDQTLIEQLQVQVNEKAKVCLNLQGEVADLQEKYKFVEEVLQAERAKCSSLEAHMDNVRSNEKSYFDLVQRCTKLEKTAAEYEGALEELGGHLSQSKLAVEDLKEGMAPLSEGQWESDKDAVSCKLCQQKFSVSRRKHHCRRCGGIFCANCSDNTMPLPSSAKPVRVCDNCYAVLLQKFSAKNVPTSQNSPLMS